MDKVTYEISMVTLLQALNIHKKRKTPYKINGKEVCRKVFRFIYGDISEE